MHDQFLKAALDEAWLGRGKCYPNPSVGAVAVVNGEIIARALHQGAGTPHAEQLLLTQIPPDLKEVTLYVTLEPCNHWGRTPPCTDAIIAYGIRRVVYGFADPNPVVEQNDTPARLQAAGIDVIYHPIAEINAFYESYAYWSQTKRPFVTVKMAQSLDGKIAGEHGAPALISNDSTHRMTHFSRYHTDIILTSARTIHMDNPQLNARMNEEVFAKPVAVILGETPLLETAQIFETSASLLLFYSKNKPACDGHPKITCFEASSDTHDLRRSIDLSVVMQTLGELGYHDVWVEAGSQLFQSLHQQGLVNRTLLYIAPKILGSKATSLYNAQIFNHPHTCQWHTMGDNVLCCLDWESASCSQD